MVNTREVPAAPSGLAERGAALWRELHEDRDRGPEERALIVEACRLVDRLDLLDAALRGDPWMHLADGEGPRLVVVVDAVAGEARRSAATLKALIGELRMLHEPGVIRGGVAAPDPDPVEVQPVEEPEEAPHDELSVRRGSGARRPADPAG